MKNVFLVFWLFVSMLSYGQETTFILVRHAEKVIDGSKNPALTPQGEIRAQHLLEMFTKADVTAIYSTNYKRTRMTVAPLAKHKALEIQTYQWKNPKEWLSTILENNAGGTVVISGHSNTTPVLANLLIGKATFTTFAEGDYGNLLIITTSKVGAGKILQVRY